ncbi:hypothetical protein [Natronomonas sp. EA1]|uniref:hypothetical protein n=1 Tax=Natronomonas sp. EA1 TaxID=3421655 RepID=UPI003EC146C5
MQRLLETGAELFTVLVELLATIALAGIGLSAERVGAAALATDTAMALWFTYIGLVALAGALLVTQNRLAPRVRAALA